MLLNDYNKKSNSIKSLEKECKKKEKDEEEEEEEEDYDKIEKKFFKEFEMNLNNKEVKKENCSLEEHKENDAIYFCPECKIFMCIKCEKAHSSLFYKHHKYNLNNNN